MISKVLFFLCVGVKVCLCILFCAICGWVDAVKQENTVILIFGRRNCCSINCGNVGTAPGKSSIHSLSLHRAFFNSFQ